MLNKRIVVLSVALPALLLGTQNLSTPAFAQFVIERNSEAEPPLQELTPPPPAAEPAAAPAYTGGAMTVTDVIIDKTDKNAVVARDGAIVEAQRTAFEVLAEKSMSPESFKAFKVPDNKTIATLVDNFEIKNEQLSATRYVANFTVRFLPEINNYIRIPEGLGKVVAAGPPAAKASAPATTPAANAAAPVKAEASSSTAAAATSQTVLVLPYYEDASGKRVLWEDPNPWREAWQATGNSAPDSSLTVTVPLGDLADVSSGNTDIVWKGDYTTLEKARINYKATEVALAVAKAGKGIHLYLYKDGKFERLKSIPGKYSDEESFKKAIVKVTAALKAPVLFGEHAAPADTAAVDTHAVDSGATAAAETEVSPTEKLAATPAEKPAAEPAPAGGRVVIEATMNFANYAQWMEAQKRLASISPPVDIEISSLTKDQAQFTLDYDGGTLASFKTALAGKGLGLDRPVVQVDESVLGSDKPTQKTIYELRLQN